jgi:hypothetical protein
MKEMKSDSWVVLECLVILALFGGASFLWEPKYAFGLGVAMTAVVSALNNAMGTKSGAKMPQQSTDAKPGQTSDTTSKITTIPDPPATPVAPVVDTDTHP